MNAPKAIPNTLPTERYELLVRAIVDYAIFMLDPTGHVISWNSGAERIKGYAAGEIIGESFERFFTEEDRQAGKPQQYLEEALREGRNQAEGWRLRKDGTRFWAMTVLDVVRDDDGELVGFAKITRDITAQREAHLSLMESERQFRLLVEGVSDYAIYMLDPEGYINSWNTGAQRIKGYDAKEVIGEHFSRFYTPEDRARELPKRALALALENGRYEAEGWRLRSNGERFWASVVIDPIRDEEGCHIGFAKVTRDITERMEASRRLEEARAQLLQSQKMEGLGQLTGGIAHDFNNLLTIILGAADMAKRLNGDQRLVAHLDSIVQAARRGADITRQLLDFARRQPLQAETLQPSERLNGILTLLKQSLRSDIELLADIPPDLYPVQVDSTELELALLNLGINARDAMGGPGKVQLLARNVTLRGEIDGLSGPFVAIALQDEGCGMPPEVRDRIFEPFFTTKKVGEGTGLGLAQVYGFAKQSQGAIRVESEVGKGTTMTLYLPASAEAAAEPGHRARRILLVEDDVALADVTASMMIEMGYEVEKTGDPVGALTALQRSPRFDLLLSDVVMPGGTNGVELANKVRERLPELPIVLMTGYSEILHSRPVAYQVLRKPFSYDDLAEALDKQLGHPPQVAAAAQVDR
jgi:PAS domain S-box-containing protein